MNHRFLYSLLFVSLSVLTSQVVSAQEQQSVKIQQGPVSTIRKKEPALLAPLKDAADVAQIHEYLRLSGDLDSFRVRWIAAFDENRSIGAPYWPEEFWTALRAEMQTTDLESMFVSLYQHGITKQLMQEVLDAYHIRGADHFKGTPECFKLGEAELALADDMDKLKLAKTSEVFTKVYDNYRPQIKAARVRYMAQHPDFLDK